MSDPIEDTLTDIAGDLLASKRNEAFVRRLLAEPPGSWHELGVLTSGLGEVESRLRSLASHTARPVHVAWLDYPPSAYGDGYGTVVFFHEELNWSMVAPLNVRRLIGDGHSEAE